MPEPLPPPTPRPSYRRLLVISGSAFVAALVVLLVGFEVLTGGTVYVRGVGFVYPGGCADVGTSTNFSVYFHVPPGAMFNLSWSFRCFVLGNGSGAVPVGSYTARSVAATTPGFAVVGTSLPTTFSYVESGTLEVIVRAPAVPGTYELEFSISCT